MTLGAPLLLALVAGLASIVICTPLAARADEPEVMLLDRQKGKRYRAGDFVVATRRAELKVEAKVTDTVDEGLLLGVDRVDGDWLWVTNKRSGWLHVSNVMPATEAIDYFSTAINRNPADPRLYARRGVARALSRDYAGALADYNEALRLRPQEAVYYGDRGCIHLALGDLQHAADDFQQELKRIGTEEPGKREIRAHWLADRLADVEAAKAAETTVTLGGPPK